MTDDRDLIRSRINILDLVGQTVQLKKAGKNWKGLCPFHPDKNPSFFVSPETGRYKCWSCNEAGDIFTWVMKTQNVDFSEAMQVLAGQAGVELAPRSGRQAPETRRTYEAAMNEALRFFQGSLESASAALEYCKRRGIDASVIAEWELGWAPEEGSALAVHMKRQGFALAECENLFLVSQDAAGGYRDKFWGRLIFPIRDERGQLVAFGGRLISDGQPKYINSSDTPLYRKSRVLYGMFRAKERLNKERRAVLVEGYLDVVACHRAGVSSALASLGTSLSEEHAKLLKRWCDEVVVLYDSDDAGRKAAERAVGILANEGLRVRVALMPQGEDPDTLLRNAGPAAVQQAVEAGLAPLDFQMQSLLKARQPAQEEFWSDAVGILANARTDLEMDKWVVRLASMYPDIRDPLQAQKDLRRWVTRVRRDLQKNPVRERHAVALEHRPLPERLTSVEFIILLAFCTEQYRAPGYMVAANAKDLFSTALAVQIGESISRAFPEGPPSGAIGEWLHRIEPDSVRQILSDLSLDFRAENLTEQRVTDTIQKLKIQREERQLSALKERQSETEKLRLLHQKLSQMKPRYERERTEEDELF